MGCDSDTENTDTKKDTSIITPIKTDSLAAIKSKADPYFSLDMITIILTEKPDMNSNKMNIQDFIVDGKSFIPAFSSKEKFTQSTGGTDLGKPVIEVNPYLFLSMLSGNETVRMNPSLADDTYFKAADLKSIYSEEIKDLSTKMSK